MRQRIKNILLEARQSIKDIPSEDWMIMSDMMEKDSDPWLSPIEIFFYMSAYRKHISENIPDTFKYLKKDIINKMQSLAPSDVIKDNKGKPLLLYHGRDATFQGKMFFATDNYRVALGFTDEQRIDDVHMLFMKMKNPFVINAKNNMWSDIPVPKQMRGWLTGTWDGITTDLVAEWAIENDYDGVIIQNVIEGGRHMWKSNVYISFNSRNIIFVEE